jgi:hypothetical protein
LEFTQTYGAIGRRQEGDNCYNFLAFMGKLCVDDDAARLIYDTRGVRRFVAGAWKVTLDLRAEDDLNAALTALAGFISGGNILGDVVLCEPEHLEELVDGAGGTVTGLAQLVIRHLAHFLASDVVPSRKTMAIAAISSVYMALGFTEGRSV